MNIYISVLQILNANLAFFPEIPNTITCNSFFWNDFHCIRIFLFLGNQATWNILI